MLCYNDNENSLVDIVEKIESFEVLENGKSSRIFPKDDKFNKLKTNIKNLFVTSRLMPAFSVSLHNETIQELKKDFWFKIHFNQEVEKNGLPFSSLLFKLEEVQGFNLIRSFNKKYDGRCLYLDLDEKTDLKELLL